MSREGWPKRMEMLRHLALREAEGSGPPSVRELGRAVGLSSPRTAHKHLARLMEGGYVERDETSWARPLRLTARGREAAAGEGAPVMGRIAAGRGMEAAPVREASGLARALLGGASPGGDDGAFFLEARGQSMTGAGIEDGDLLLVVPDPSPPDGTVVAAMIVGPTGDGTEVTVKRLFREGDRVRLRAENGAHRDIVVGAEEVEVHGRVEYIVRRPWRRGA
jgi:repressor LexA